jgi:hypothetical protein
MHRDWRRYVVWGVWAAGLTLAIASVAMNDSDRELNNDAAVER